MEKAETVLKEDMNEGFYIELTCMFCCEEKIFVARTKEELQKVCDDEGWFDFDSDKHQTHGHWCGCEH
jgi:hypothetical protein